MKIPKEGEEMSKNLETEKPKACVITYGCQQNKNDSEKIMGTLEKMGYEECENPEGSDLVIFNTCAVRENPESKLFGNLGALKNIKRKRKNMKIGVCGCMSQQAHIAEIITKRFKFVDFVIGTDAVDKLPNILKNCSKLKRIDLNIDHKNVFETNKAKRTPPPCASVTIMYGCNNFCSYCVVPHVRGRERSRNPENILGEIESLASFGYKEITLLGQNVNSYGNNLCPKVTFTELLGEICKINGIQRIRFISSHPKDVPEELIKIIANNDKICKQFHLPVQSGSSRILKLMNRKYKREDYLNLVQKIREYIPNIALTTDIIVGFPGETSEDFNETLSLIKIVRFDMIFSFIYSRRINTGASFMFDPFETDFKKSNFQRLINTQNRISKEKNNEYLGRTENVLVEGKSKKDKNMLFGRTDSGKIVNFKGEEDLVSKFVQVKITRSQTWCLFGEEKK